MGFEVTQGLIIGKNTLLVERPSDILHLQAVSSVLRKQKRAFLDPAWAICPAGGIDKVPGSVGAAWQEWIQTEAWSRLAPSTRYKIWWEAWNKRIEPFFGDCAPDSITMKMIDEWRADMETVSGIDAAHKALKTFRAFWRVMQALRYTQLTDPSKKVVNRAPRARHQRFGYGEGRPAGERRLAGRLSRSRVHNHRNLGFGFFASGRADAPGQAQAARREDQPYFLRLHRGRPRQDRYRRNRDALAIWRLPCPPLLGRTWGRAHGRVRTVRAIVMPGDKRQLCDMRRSGVVETFTGGGNARDVAEKFGNTIDHSNVLFKTYSPVDLEKVRQADAARLEGRRRKNKG
jgi:hypothetical protein